MNEVCNAWHEELGHCGYELLRVSIPHNRGVKRQDLKETADCKPCSMRNSIRKPRGPLKSDDRKAAKPLEQAFLDVVGPMCQESITKLCDFVTLIDLFSGFSLFRFADRKCKVANTVVARFQKLKVLYSTRIRKITCINCNNFKLIRTDRAVGTLVVSFRGDFCEVTISMRLRRRIRLSRIERQNDCVKHYLTWH